MARSRHEGPGATKAKGEARQNAKDFYERLGGNRDDSTREISAAYRKASKTYHPQQGGKEADFRKLTEAFNVLKSPVKRAIYHFAESQNISIEDIEKIPGIQAKAEALARSEESIRASKQRIRKADAEMQERRQARQSGRRRAEAPAEDPEVARRRAAAERQALLDEGYARDLAKRSGAQLSVAGPKSAPAEAAAPVEPPDNLPTDDGAGTFGNATIQGAMREALKKKGMETVDDIPTKPMPEASAEGAAETFDIKALEQEAHDTYYGLAKALRDIGAEPLDLPGQWGAAATAYEKIQDMLKEYKASESPERQDKLERDMKRFTARLRNSISEHARAAAQKWVAEHPKAPE